MHAQIKCIFICFLVWATVLSLSGQCEKIVWIDDELNEHAQPYILSFLPDVSYQFQNEEYKSKKVSGLSVSADGEVLIEKRYDKDGYLMYERYPNPEGGFILRNYNYQNEHHLIKDSTRYVIYDFKNDALTGKLILPIKTDTAVVLSLKRYNTAGKLLFVHNKVAENFNWEKFWKPVGFFADSLFFYYDTCGNLEHTDWYDDTIKGKISSDYTFSRSRVDNQTEIHIYNSQGPHEFWTFNARGQPLHIDLNRGEVIDIEYKNDRVSRYIYTANTDHRDNESFYVLTTAYTYDRSGLVRLVLKNYRHGGQKGKGNNRKIKIKRDKNGLPLTTLGGKKVAYTFH